MVIRRYAALVFPTLLLMLAPGCQGGSIPIKIGATDTGDTDTGASAETATDSGADSDTAVETGGDTDTDSGDDTDTGGDTDTDTGEVIDADIVVDCAGSADFTTIQDAINASVSGDVIGVKACTYHERLHYLGKAITVYGIDGSAATILDGDEGGTVLNVESGEGAGTRFAGFTITGGYDPYDGSAVEVNTSNLEMEDVVITGNSDGQSVIECLGGWLDLTDVTVTDNAINSGGQAVLASGGSLTAEGLTADCDGGTAALYGHVSLLLDTSTLVCDTGYGIENHHGEIWMQRSTVTGGVYGIYTFDEEDEPSEKVYIYNSAVGGGSIGLYALYEDVRLINSVFWGTDSALSMTACNTASYAENAVFMDAACGISGDQAFPSRYSAFWGNTADGCGVTVSPSVSADPQFTSFPDDLTLKSGSPLIDAGDPAHTYDDTDGSRDDIGVFGGPWGSW